MTEPVKLRPGDFWPEKEDRAQYDPAGGGDWQRLAWAIVLQAQRDLLHRDWPEKDHPNRPRSYRRDGFASDYQTSIQFFFDPDSLFVSIASLFAIDCHRIRRVLVPLVQERLESTPDLARRLGRIPGWPPKEEEAACP